ncbi:MAG: Asp-tRNA(Asn)/Glu-tRNA(Gln) amidotransferase subunit GatC [Patescibacteria group bacterium]
MGSLSKDDVLHVAKLAKLTLSPKEIIKFQEQLSKIIDYVSQLSEVDTLNLGPTSQTTGLENVFRQDEVKPPSFTNDGYFAVDKILNKEE